MAEDHDRSPEITEQVTEENVRTIADLERAAIERRNLTERVSDHLTRIIGSLPFLALHLLGIPAWFAVNLGFLHGVRPFDPFPSASSPSSWRPKGSSSPSSSSSARTG